MFDVSLIPEYSKIKALKQAKEQDNTGSMEAAYQEELKRLTGVVRGLQDRNQTRYNTAIAALRNAERFNPKDVLSFRKLGYTKSVFYGTPIKQNTEVVLNEALK